MACMMSQRAAKKSILRANSIQNVYQKEEKMLKYYFY